MHEELRASDRSKTWTLVSCTLNECYRLLVCFKTKLKSDGSVVRLMAHVVAKGYDEVSRIDFDEMFNHVIKPNTVQVS